MATNQVGFECEDMIRAVLADICIPYIWGTPFEDHCLGVDCWLGPQEIAVDFTLIYRGQLLSAKLEKCMRRGVVLVSLDRITLFEGAINGSQRALDAIEQELRVQLPPQLKKLNGDRMTREKAEAARLEAARK